MMADDGQILENRSIFVERKYVSLGMKLVCTFAVTYYMLYFLFMMGLIAWEKLITMPWMWQMSWIKGA